MKTIKTNGKEYPCRVTMGAMLRFKNETGRDVGEMRSEDLSLLVTFLWCCVASACNADKVEFGMSLLDFADGIDPDSVTEFYNETASNAGAPDAKSDPPTS